MNTEEKVHTVDLHHRRSGPKGGVPVVILHGLFGTLDNWGSIGRELAEPSGENDPALDVVLVDLRDHGRSPWSDGTSYPAMAADVHALVSKLELKDIVLVGHSMGGKAAMAFAQEWPALLKHLVVVDISPREHENNHAHIIEAMRSADLSPGRTRKDIEDHVSRYVREPGVVQFLLKNLHWVSDEQLGWRVNVERLHQDLDAILAPIASATVRVPTLFIRGGQSDYILREDIPAIQEQFPKARVETVPFAGHWVHAQAPDEVIGMIREVAGA